MNNINSSNKKSLLSQYLELSTFTSQQFSKLWLVTLLLGFWEKGTLGLIILASITRTNSLFTQGSSIFHLGNYTHVI